VCVCVLCFLPHYILLQKLIIFSVKTICLVHSISYFFPYKRDRAIFLYSTDYLRTSSLHAHRLPLTHLLSKLNNFSSFLHHSFFMLSKICADYFLFSLHNIYNCTWGGVVFFLSLQYTHHCKISFADRILLDIIGE